MKRVRCSCMSENDRRNLSSCCGQNMRKYNMILSHTNMTSGWYSSASQRARVTLDAQSDLTALSAHASPACGLIVMVPKGGVGLKPYIHTSTA